MPIEYRKPNMENGGPLYVEIGALLGKNLTGIGRFIARLVEALLRRGPLRLFTTVSAAHARAGGMSTALTCGYELAIDQAEPGGADEDLEAWARRLLHRPRRRHDHGLARSCPGLFTLLRPAERHFQRELGVLYDFTPLLMPWAHAGETREHFGRFFARTVQRCDKAVAISRATREDAAWLCALPPDDVVIGYPGPSLCARAHASALPVERSRHVILVVSALEPRKNGRFLLDWFLDTDALGPEFELWWAGPRAWWATRAWLSNMDRRGRPGKDRRDRVKFLGMVSDARLCELYRRAAFTIYPSLYEGFGFPVLDSLLHDAPVACSLHSSLQEFAGPGVYYFDACDHASLDAACRDLLADGPPAIDAAALRRRFSWDRLAETVLSLCA
jgi:glycosyltransferase involved in cell wall biosynthesis